MKMTSLVAFARVSAIALFMGFGANAVYGQGSPSSLFSGSGGGSTGQGSTGATTLGAAGSTSSGSSLFNGTGSSTGSTGSSSSMGSTGSSGSSGSGGSSGITAGSGTTIQQAAIGQSGAPLTSRVDALNRGTSNIVSANADIIGGQTTSNNNQFASLFSQIGRQIGQGGNFNQQGGRNTARPSIRIPLKLGFVAKPISVPQFTDKFESRIVKLNGITAINPIRLSMDGSTAVLTGVVATEQDRILAEGVAMLEPLVESVRNEIAVQEPESNSDSQSPPPKR